MTREGGSWAEDWKRFSSTIETSINRKRKPASLRRKGTNAPKVQRPVERKNYGSTWKARPKSSNKIRKGREVRNT